MNSLINTNNGDCHEHHRKCVDPCPPQYCECKSHEELHPVPGSALLEIGRTSSQIINASTATTITATNPLLIAQVTLDPTCLCFPNLKIEFSTFVTLTGLLTVGDSVTFQLSRIRYGYSPNAIREPLETLTVNVPVTIPAITPAFSIPAAFIYTEENIRLRESTYVVEAIAATILATDTGSIQLRNTNIAALAVGGTRLD
jgi:hypothetical protein